MKFTIIGKKNDFALLESGDIVIKDTQSALDLIATTQYETDYDKLIICKSSVIDDFFVLSTGIVGEI